MSIMRDPRADPAARATAFTHFVTWAAINFAGVWLAVQVVDGVEAAGPSVNLAGIAVLLAISDLLALEVVRRIRFRRTSVRTLLALAAALLTVNVAFFLVVELLAPTGFPIVVRDSSAALAGGLAVTSVGVAIASVLALVGVIPRPV